MASRYLATVRRAISMPASRSFSTMVSSDKTSAGGFAVDQLFDAVPHRFGGVRLAAMRRGDRRGEEIFQLEDAAAGRHIFVGGDAGHRRFVHADGFGDGFQIERAQMLDATGKKRILLAHDLVGDFEDGSSALIERTYEPRRALQTLGQIGFVGVAARGGRNFRIVALVDQDLRQRVGVEFDEPARRPAPGARTRRARSAARPRSRRRDRVLD